MMLCSLIIAMLETSLKSTTPTAKPPTKPDPLPDKELHIYDDEVWSKIYNLMDKSVAVGQESDNDILIDIS